MRYFLIFALLLWQSSVWALQVEPMVTEFTPTGQASQKNMRIVNTNEAPLTLEISAHDLTLDANSKEILTANEDDFLILPMTVTLAPGAAQTVVVRYIGEPLLKESKAYRINIDQVNVASAQTEDVSSVGMLISFRTLYNVVPQNTKEDVRLLSKGQQGDKWVLTFENSGDRYSRLIASQWQLDDGKQQVVLQGMSLSQAIDGSFLPPHSQRKVIFTPPAGFDINSTQLTFSTTK
ncbi:fimbria/pilus periplasmic chaperone [Pseudoalteromonas sp. YIC-827]|uniref:Fimbria/pilus periplasmic chaperone n=1 Tax=Pseudoalteromonas qingdaonensis TaxID=3131913 RepID=A0ABU9MVT6_9GAMM